MAYLRSLQALAISTIIAGVEARIAPLHKAHPNHKHEALQLARREAAVPPVAGSPPNVPPTTSALPDVLKYITPSPGASPVAVTEQSQIVTSYVPEYTLCELPPLEFYPITPSAVSAQQTTIPYTNYSISTPSGNGTCTTMYSPTITMVCATTLTALATQYTVSQCPQYVTFSTEYGHVLVTPTQAPVGEPNMTYSVPSLTVQSGLRARQASNAVATITPGPSIETLTTYYLAPWQQLTAGTAPSEVDLKVCRTFSANDSTECIREYQVWSTSLVTMTSTCVTSINISTTIPGRSQLLVETFVANITEQLTTFSMSTNMDLEFQTEWTTTESSTRAISTSTGATVYETMTVELASKTS